MAKQNLKRRIARETNEIRKANLIARLNTKKAGVSIATTVHTTVGDSDHVHGENCTHHYEAPPALSPGVEHRHPNIPHPGGGGDGRKS